MVAPARPRGIVHGTAALVAAVSLLTAGAGRAPAAEAASPPALSLAVFLHHFPGEGTYLSDLTNSYAHTPKGRVVQLNTYEWPDAPSKLKHWVKDWRSYAPDMVVVRDLDLPLVLGHIVSLEGRFPLSLLRQFYPGLLAQARAEGVLVALPWQTWPQALYYRADVLREKGLSPPKTPEELLDVARRVARPPELYGFGLPGRADGGAPEMLLSFLRAEGGVLFDADGRLAVTAEPSRRALRLWGDLVQSHATQPEVLSWTEGELAELFARGRLAMVLEQPWLLREVRQVPPPMMVGVAPMPRAPGGCDSVRTDCVVILDTASDVPACVDFLQYALSRERQQLQAALGVPSVRKDCAGDLPEDERWGAFRQALEHARGPQPESWSAIAALFERLLYLVASGRRSVDEAMAAVDVDLIGEPDAQRIGLPAPHPTEGVTPRERAGNR